MDPFLAEIRIFGFNYAPRGWAQCNGQILPISQNTALFSLVGTTYGGNGTNTFGLPNLQGNAVVSRGQGPGLSPWSLGQQAGTASVTIDQTQMPAHNHALMASSTKASGTSAANQQIAAGVKGTLLSSFQARMYSTGAPATQLSPQSLAPSGGNQPHNNFMPYLALNFCISLDGAFPQRS